uniref:G-protein coupled receptors family 2 profile 1 domain-containing protein n=1 Tax=Astyanax mexicanus TaxID=7994 RepID=A0A3B1JR47_ASTMX
MCNYTVIRDTYHKVGPKTLHMLIIVISLKAILFVFLGPVCNRTWDGWLCWEDTDAGVTTQQHCPDYFQDFDPSGINSAHLSTCPRYPA